MSDHAPTNQKEQINHVRLIELREGYTAEQLIEALFNRNLTPEQATKIEEKLYPLSKYDKDYA